MDLDGLILPSIRRTTSSNGRPHHCSLAAPIRLDRGRWWCFSLPWETEQVPALNQSQQARAGNCEDVLPQSEVVVWKL